MSDYQSNFELPKNIEHYLSALSKICANDGQKEIQKIIVNSHIRIHEEWSFDNWNGGTYGHALYLVLPEPIYLSVVKQKTELQNEIRDKLNALHNIQNEFIGQVFLEMEIAEDDDWRKESGLLLTRKRSILPDTKKRIWENDGYKVFLSHKTEVKKEVAILKEKLKIYGISCFVAHKDIHPTQEWQKEIESALFSMDSLIAILSDNFHDSLWTDQEVGVAFGRDVPIISLKLGMDPYGFIGKFQALTCSWEKAAQEIVKILVKHELMLNAYIKAIQNCQNFDNGNLLAELLPSIDNLSTQQVSDLLIAFNTKGQVNESYGFNGKNPSYYGKGLAYHLSRLTGNNYRLMQSGKIEVKP